MNEISPDSPEWKAMQKHVADMPGDVRSPFNAGAAGFLAGISWERERATMTCEWVEIEEGSNLWNTCKEGEEFQVHEGLELWPHCHWCGGKIVAIAAK